MGRPQFGFPRWRFAAGTATVLAIRPDHTPPWVTVRQNPRMGGIDEFVGQTYRSSDRSAEVGESTPTSLEVSFP